MRFFAPTSIALLASCAFFSLPGAVGATQLAQASQLFGGEVEISMQVDIRPGSDENYVDPRAGRVFPMAILGSAELDSSAINPRTITLRGIGVLLVGKTDKSWCKQTDINDDGFIDLVCNVHITGYRVAPGDYRIRVEAETYDKLRLAGEDGIRVPAN